MITKFFKDITGITAKEEKNARISLSVQELFTRELEAALLKKEATAKKRKETKEKAIENKLSPKDRATKKGEPWVDVIGFQVNPDNIRHGFYELDWNDLWVEKLRLEGYGYEADPDEEIIARWYRDICLIAAADEGVDMTDRDTGFINVRKLDDGRAEIG